MKISTLFYILLFSISTSAYSASWNKNNCPNITNSKVGINFSQPGYNASQASFANLMKQSDGWHRPWSSQFKNIPIKQDKDGYPTSIDRDRFYVTIIHDDKWGRDTANDNKYVLSYDGEGEFNLLLQKPGSATIVEQRPGRIVYQITGKGRTMLRLNWTNPSNHARNMSFVALSDEATFKTQPFRKEFLSTWGSLPAARFMDWLATNNSTNSRWNQRTTLSDMQQASKAGVAYEYIIKLSNLTKTNPWINIPHLATNNYVRQLATLFKNSLDPNLTVYVEYTNEAWNSIFAQTKYMAQQAARQGINRNEYYSDRTSAIMDIWTNVYRNVPKKRYVRVMATQFSSQGVTNRILRRGNPSQHVDALAVGPYFGGSYGRANSVNATLRMSPSALAQRLLVTDLPQNMDLMRIQKNIANSYNLRLIAYEAGQHLVGVRGPQVNNQKLTNLLVATNRHPKMKDIYFQYLKNWNAVSNDLIVLFSSVKRPGKYGSWGLLENGSQTIQQSPKASGVTKYMCGGV
ncbi:MAG: hypothetical protein ACC657_17445 [Thiohalomonadales bacterium]